MHDQLEFLIVRDCASIGGQKETSGRWVFEDTHEEAFDGLYRIFTVALIDNIEFFPRLDLCRVGMEDVSEPALTGAEKSAIGRHILLDLPTAAKSRHEIDPVGCLERI